MEQLLECEIGDGQGRSRGREREKATLGKKQYIIKKIRDQVSLINIRVQVGTNPKF